MPYLDPIADEIAAADLVVCRAGAMTIGELAAIGRAAILVPFAAATNNHQELNARVVEQAGGAIVITEAELSPERLAQTISEIWPIRDRAATDGGGGEAAGHARCHKKHCRFDRKISERLTYNFTRTVRMIFDQIRTIHFVGIGGIGMSGIAEILNGAGLSVTGCDLKRSASTDLLASRGIAVTIGHDPSHIDGNDLVVITSAVKGEHAEVDAARAHGIRS